MNIVDIQKALSAHPEGTFLDVLPFNDHNFGACRITGVSPVWEMHPETDEFFYILDGHFEIELLEDESPTKYSASKGEIFAVPRGIWHKPAAPDGCTFMHFTPGQSLHSDADDPRITHSE